MLINRNKKRGKRVKCRYCKREKGGEGRMVEGEELRKRKTKQIYYCCYLAAQSLIH